MQTKGQGATGEEWSKAVMVDTTRHPAGEADKNPAASVTHPCFMAIITDSAISSSDGETHERLKYRTSEQPQATRHQHSDRNR